METHRSLSTHATHENLDYFFWQLFNEKKMNFRIVGNEKHIEVESNSRIVISFLIPCLFIHLTAQMEITLIE